MEDWREKLKSIKIIKKEKKTKPIALPAPKIKIPVRHYVMPEVTKPDWSKEYIVSYVISCTGRRYSQKPVNSTDKKKLVTCPKCLREI
jgi:hypothetical protein